ncbi:glycosyltransferase family 2 protein [Alistipes sp.]|uniref:glycosyltransferase family 2 protein n=1 Tax=Alistipes sp. TaxID=1872444 RepID=UPI003AEF7F9A
MIVLGWIFFAFGLVRLAVGFVNWASRPYLPRSRELFAPQSEVSVLIPARNEELNIGHLLQDLGRERAAIREILVYDDHSTDATASIVRRFARKNPLVRLLPAEPLPAGWLGKNHACHCLSREAAGRYLLFLDADVRIRGQAVARALEYVQRTGVELLSVFPHQLMPDPGTRMAVPLMNWILLSLLPLDAVRRAPQEALCAANGQFLFFEAALYRTVQPHRKFRAAPVEDMAIAREYKRCGHPVAVLLGCGDVECTMYTSLGDAVAGFSKNFFSFFGGSEWLCYLFVVATTAAPFLVFLFLGTLPGLIYLIVIVLIRIFVSLASRQSARMNVLLLIPQQLVLWRIVVNASVRKRKRRLLWKGRNIYIEQ